MAGNEFSADVIKIANLRRALSESVDGDLVFRDKFVPEGVKLKDLAAAQSLAEELRQALEDLDATYATDAELAAINNALGARITSNDNDITTINSNIVALSGELVDLTNALNDLDLEYATGAQLAAISGVLQDQIWSNDVDISGHEGRITTLENSDFGYIIQDDSISFTQRSNLNFIGDIVTIDDNATSGSTDVTFDALTVSQIANITSGLNNTDIILRTDLVAVSGNLQDQIDSISEIISGGVTFTNSNPSIALGGISEGTTFDVQTTQQMFDQLLYPELEPVLTSSSLSFSDDAANYQEVGDDIDIIFTGTFDRGSISPDYNTSYPYSDADRSGAPNTYNYTGTSLTPSISSTSDTDIQSISAHTVALGQEQWTCAVDYDAGPQPITNKGNNFSSPEGPGTSSTKSTSITGVYAVYATTTDITQTTGQPLASMSSTYFQTDMVAETGGNKQIADFPNDGGAGSWATITGIQFYNTVSSTWEWIGGTKVNSLLTFDETSTTHNDAGATSRTYRRFTHNGVTTGARQLRWHTTI
jgi:hypothetical protein